MAQLTIRDREVIIATFAMRTFMTAIEAVRDSWREEDIMIAQRLLEKLERERELSYARRTIKDAEGTD